MTEKGDRQPSLAGAGAVTAMATLTSRVTGLLRDATLAAFFPKELTDVFWAAFRIPNAFRRLLGEGAVSAAIIPVFTQVEKEDGNVAARQLLGSTLKLVLTATVALTILGWIFAPAIVDLLLNFPEESSDRDLENLATALVRVMFPYLIFVCGAAVLAGVLNSLGKFFVPAITPVFFNLFIIGFAWGAWKFFEIHPFWPALGVLVGGFFQFAAQFPSLGKRGYLPDLLGRVRDDPGVTKAVSLFVPASLSLGVTQINILVNTNLASALGPGPISYLFYSNRLAELPLGVFGLAIATAAFPRFSRSALEDHPEALRGPLINSLTANLIVLVPSTVGLCVLAAPLVDLLFNRGAFAEQGGLAQTVPPLRIFSLGLVSFSCVKLIGNLCYALGETRTPIIAGVAAAAANLVLAYHLRFTPLGHSGIALAVVIAATLQVAVMLLRLRARVPWGWFLDLTTILAKVGVSSALMGILVWAWARHSEGYPSWVVVLLGMGIGTATYGACGIVLFRDQLKRVLGRRDHGPG